MINLNLFGISICLLAFIQSSHAQLATSEYASFKVDSYALEYPNTWTYKLQPAPDGSQLHMFFGPQTKNAIPYCHTTQQSLKLSLAPNIVKMNLKQRQQFFATASDQKLLFSLYDNLPSAKAFQLIHTNATVLADIPAFVADFSFRTPEGYYYRVRSHYTFWPKAQLSIWCQTVSKNETDGDDSFRSNLANFQKFIASFKLKQ